MLPDMSEHACRAADITPESALFLTPLDVPPGQAIVSYIDGIGRIEGESRAREDGGLRVFFRLTGLQFERLTSRLRWLGTARGPQAPAVRRRHTRFVPRDGHARVTLPSGRQHACEIIDISLSGAAIRIDIKPGLGSHLLLGRTRGRVVRHLDAGAAIEFIRQLDQGQLRDAIS